jgi:hypothetical protein
VLSRINADMMALPVCAAGLLLAAAAADPPRAAPKQVRAWVLNYIAIDGR